MIRRLLFASLHCYADPSSGAALTTRDILELLAIRGVDCRAFSAGLLDFDREIGLESLLNALGAPYERHYVRTNSAGPVEVFDSTAHGVRFTLMPTARSRPDRAPSENESSAYFELAVTILDRFRPEALLTYGGQAANLALAEAARSRGIPVMFHLHNLSYHDVRSLKAMAGILTPSEFAARIYRRRLERNCDAIPPPLRRDRVVADDPEPRYVTFVNPQITKGAAVFARIADELDKRRPDIPFLVVEGRTEAASLAHLGLDLSGLTNLNRMANVSDPRTFYKISRVVLIPSLIPETFGKVAAEALANGIPVLASDRGALPETLGDAGFAFALPWDNVPHVAAIPSARDVAPWTAILERLWDDPDWERRQQSLALSESKLWEENKITDAYLNFFSRFLA